MDRMKQIHPSASALYTAAKPSGDDSPAKVARRLDVSAQTLQNWETRGVSRGGAMKAQRAYRIDVNALINGHVKPISNHEATQGQAPSNQLKKVRVEGAAAMDDKGFWRQGDDEIERTEWSTRDADAYAIRLLTQRFQPTASLGQCILISPAAKLIEGRQALVILVDGRRTFRRYHGHDYGIWHFTDVNDGNAYLDLADNEVDQVMPVTAVFWTEG